MKWKSLKLYRRIPGVFLPSNVLLDHLYFKFGMIGFTVNAKEDQNKSLFENSSQPHAKLVVGLWSLCNF